MNRNNSRSLGFASIAAMLLAGAAFAADDQPKSNPERDAYFGETHLHTSWSVDAWVIGNRLTGPDEALKYAQGETIKHPLGYDIKIDTPLDWMGVTDHSEYVGVTREANTPGSAISKLPEAQGLILKDPNNPDDVQRVFLYLLSLTSRPPIKAFMTPEVAGSIWKENVKIADANNHPGKFTAFCSYEWTAMPNNMNLHRNIFFRDCAKVPTMPFSSLDSNKPEELWSWMDTQRKAGNELLAISHNANLSDGRMYPTDVDGLGRPIDAAWAASRDRNERLIEMKQIKGTSETHPLLSPNDEFSDFEIMSTLLGLPAGSGRIAHIVGSYARQALKDGLTMQDVRGFNPYKFGFGAGSDAHNSASPYREDNFFGGHASVDGTIQTRMSGHIFNGIDARIESPGGLTGAWAETNTRASIWDAMYRKETFATSGPRIKVRLFGGWDYKGSLVKERDWVKAAYKSGVPMGSDLPAMKGAAPTFALWAIKDPTSGNLDRIQIVKGWSKSGQSFEKIYDVVWSGDRIADKWTGVVPAIESSVDSDKATYTNTVGSSELKTVWTDPDFDPSVHAFYYARVLEIPTPRWTTIQAHELGIAPPDITAATVQERAWTSPIWYTPSSDARKKGAAGTTVADLTAKGAKALSDADLKTLLVGKSLWVRNKVTGTYANVAWDETGNALAYFVGDRALLPSESGDLAARAYDRVPTPYSIANGKVVTMFANTPFEMTLYKSGDQYFGARSNEFGFANYEFTAKGPANMLELPANAKLPKDQAAELHAKE
jgi:hypothetical protein